MKAASTTASTQPNKGSDRKRVSLPRADQSVLAWWDAQDDPSLSVRLLIRNEIERNGYIDVACTPVTQQPRRGRRPADHSQDTDEQDFGAEESGSAAATSEETGAPAASLRRAAKAPEAEQQKPEPERADEPDVFDQQPSQSARPVGDFSSIDDLMNG